MKNRKIKLVVFIAIVVVAVCSVYTSQNNVKLSDLALSNIDALADYGETAPWDCYHGRCCYDPAFDCFTASPMHFCPDMRSGW